MRKILFLISLFLVIFSSQVRAFDRDTFVTVSNPIYGSEGWSDPKVDPLDLPKLQYSTATESGLLVSWILRYDALNDASISAYFKKISNYDNTQAIGALLEITPNLAKSAGLPYQNSLTNYYPEDRKKLIDSYMSSFKDKFGFLPKTVGANFLDSVSLQYLQKRYSVMVALINSDEFSDTGTRLWGSYLGSSYIPSKNNILLPSKNSQNRVDLVVSHWNQIDLYNFNQNTIPAKLTAEYFGRMVDLYSQKDFNEFTHINFGLANTHSVLQYGNEQAKIYQKLDSIKTKNRLKYVSLETLGGFVLNRYPEASPVYFYKVSDSLGTDSGTVYWYQNPFYRIGFKVKNSITTIFDFRAYNSEIYEDYFVTPNQTNSVKIEVPAVLDSYKFPEQDIKLDFDLSKSKIDYQGWRITFSEGDRSLKLNPNDIVFTNINPEIKSSSIQIIKNQNQTVWKIISNTPFKPQVNHTFTLVSVFVLLVIATFKKHRVLSIGLMIAFITTLTVIRSGGLYPFGLGVWGPNGHDAIFHLSLIEKFSQFPGNLEHPQFSGTKLSNYHFLFDYVSGITSMLLGISPLTFYFVIFPIVSSVAIVLLLKKLFSEWRLTDFESILSYFFVFLTGSLGFIPSLLNGRNPLYSESSFWANQSVSILLNPPYAVSIILLLTFLILLSRFKNATIAQILILGVIGGLLAQTKIYAFILICLGLLFARKFKILTVVSLVGILISLPFTSVSGSPFDFSPFWFTKSMFASYDRLWWPRLVQAWQTYEIAGIWPKLLAVNFFALIVFLLGNLSTRILSLRYFVEKKSLNLSEKVSSYIIIFGIIIPLVFIQKINPWNTIQFLYYSLFFLGIFTARGVALILTRQNSLWQKVLTISFICAISIITTVGTVSDYVGFYSSSRISFTELQALDVLCQSPRGIVLTPLYSQSFSGKIATPKPLYSYVSTAYISAFSGQPEFLSDTINLDITGFDYTVKSRDVQRFFNTLDQEWAISFLKSNNIRYVYLPPLQKMNLAPDQVSLIKIFDSGEISIYKFNEYGKN